MAQELNVVEHDPSYFEDDEDNTVAEKEEARIKEIHRICKGEIELSAGYDEDELVDARKEALDYYFGRPRGDELEGRSEIQSMDVADMTEATLAEVMPLYANPQLVCFGAVNPRDTEQAKMESRYCNHAFMELNSGWTVLYEAVKDALLQKNCFLDTYVHECVVPKYEQYEGMTEMDILEISQIEGAEIVDWEEKQEFDEVLGAYPVFDITVRTLEKSKKLIVESFAPEDFGFTINHRTNDPRDMRFCYRRIITTKSDLLAQGHDETIVESLKPYISGDDQVDSHARNQLSDEDEWDSYSQVYVELFKCFIVYDYDGDGIAELNQVLICEDEVVERKWVRNVSFSSGSPFLMSHRFLGMSMHDKVKMVQDSKTKFLRQWHDNADHMNNRRLEVVENQTNLEDALNSRPGGIVRTKSRGVVNPIPVDDIGPSCENALNYMDSVRSERGGASLDMQTQNMDIGERVGSQGVERQYASKEKIAAMIARTLAETLIRQTYFNIHAALHNSISGPQDFQMDGDWFQTDPSSWISRESLTIDVGMSISERTAKVSTLRGMLELQIKAMEMGAEDVMVNRKKIYNLIMDIGYTSGLQNPDRYWIDPDSKPAQEALQKKQQAAQKQAEEAKQMQRMLFEYQKYIEEQKDKIKVYEIENDKFLTLKKEFNDMVKHNDQMLEKFTSLELQYDTDIQNQGQD